MTHKECDNIRWGELRMYITSFNFQVQTQEREWVVLFFFFLEKLFKSIASAILQQIHTNKEKLKIKFHS